MADIDKWDRRFMDLARHVAQWSKDPSTKVGAVLVGVDRRNIALGYNGFPPGISDHHGRLADRSIKYRLIQHAERNVLDNARFEVALGTLYCTHLPCSECTKSIISRRIARIVYRGSDDLEYRWSEEFRWTRMMAEEAGVDIVEIGREE